MTFDSFGAVTLTLGFVVPGFIYGTVLRWFTIPVLRGTSVEVLGYFTFSCWNYAFWSWLIYFIFKLEWSALQIGLAWFVIIFGSPVVAGLLIGGYIIKSDWYQGRIGRARLMHSYPAPTAWESVWSQTGPCWVGIVLRDGSEIYGLWDERSYASSDVKEKDIYVSKVYQRSEDGGWVEVKNTAGMLVCGDDIVAIQLWKDAEPEER